MSKVEQTHSGRLRTGWTVTQRANTISLARIGTAVAKHSAYS